ncbi:MAG: hypothetical protein ABIH01_01120, partial [Candidatus Omnitrophota bacterium]
NAPHQVKLRGEWSLSKNHDLRFTLDKWRKEAFADQLTLQGDIIDIDKNSLLFAVTTTTKQGAQSRYILKLEGSWQADAHNRLTFRVKREKARHDILIFDGIWDINKNHHIVYQYEKAQLIRKLKKIRTLIFKGYWDIKDRARISYVMDKNTNSVFDFKTGLGILRDNYIKYELGIGASRRVKPVKRTITLFGTWKIKKGVGLEFEIKYDNKKIQAIVFGAEAKLTDKDTISFKLRNNINKEIGAKIELSHKILKGNGEAFLRLLKSKRESAILVGSSWQW